MAKTLQDSRPPREIRLKKIALALGALASLSTVAAAWAGSTAYQQHQQVVQVTNDVHVAVGQLDTATASAASLESQLNSLRTSSATLQTAVQSLQSQLASKPPAGPTTTDAGTATSSTSSSSGVPPGPVPAVRHSGPLDVVINAQSAADLDAAGTDKTWSQKTGDGQVEGPGLGSDYISIYDPARRLNLGTGAVDYQACVSQEARFAQGIIKLADLSVGSNICVRTSGHRMALLTVTADPNPQEVKFDVKVWEKSS